MKSIDVQLAKTIRITSRFRGEEIVHEFHKQAIVVGRLLDNDLPDLDLQSDMNVSRRHARISADDDCYWIEDTGSRFGTFVNREPVTAGKRRLLPGDVVRLGDTELRIHIPMDAAGSFAQIPASRQASGDDKINITASLDGKAPTPVRTPEETTSLLQRQSRLLELPLEFASANRLDRLLQSVMNRVLEVVPAAERGALLLREKEGDILLLAAFVSDGEPPVSETWPVEPLHKGKRLSGKKTANRIMLPASSDSVFNRECTLPLIWRGKILGVICVDNTRNDSAFKEEDLRLLLSVAHYAALFVANYQLQQDLRDNTKVLERLLTNFSPKIRQTLVEKARRGQLRPGGEESEVTILFSDIRGFTGISAGMDPTEVVAMLNDYLPALAKAIFEHDGTIDKYIGDAIVAVFGSPEADVEQHTNAVRAAFAMQKAIREINFKRADRGDVICEIGIGLHCGKVLHGFIGYHERLEFTVIGDAVNRASRYCDGAKAGELLISPELYQRVFKLAHADKTQITTKDGEGLQAYRLRMAS